MSLNAFLACPRLKLTRLSELLILSKDGILRSDTMEVSNVKSKKELLLSEIEQIPEPFLDEVLDFVQFLKTKTLKERLSTAIASESSLKKDWMKPEEEEAGQNL